MFKNSTPKFSIVTIYLGQKSAYIPTQIRYDTEQAVEGEPVYSCKPILRELLLIIEKILASQDKRLPSPDSMNEVFKNAALPMLKATKLRSWTQLAKNFCSYMIVITENDISLSISRLDKKGRYEFPTSLRAIYPKNVPLENLVLYILDDYKNKKNAK